MSCSGRDNNICSNNKSKVLFQNPDENLEKFDYINKFEEKKDNSQNNFTGFNGLGVKVLEKMFGFFVKKNKQDNGF